MRHKRTISEANIYHTICRGVGRQLIFEDDRDRATFVALLKTASCDYEVEIYAWCLMSNHVHLLLHAPLGCIANFQKYACGNYAQLFNKRHDRVGHLFQERYKSEAIDTEQYLFAVVRYIHANPLNSGICSGMRYPWSSYNEYLSEDETDKISQTDFVLDCYGGVGAFLRHHSLPDTTPVMDVETSCSKSRTFAEHRALSIAESALIGIRPGAIKELPKRERNSNLKLLLEAGLSVRQIERITGVGRGVIQHIKPDS